MTYVDDDDFEDFDANDDNDEELSKDEAGRCEECGIKVKKDDAITCPLCSAVYHEWCVKDCLRCKTLLKIE